MQPEKSLRASILAAIVTLLPIILVSVYCLINITVFKEISYNPDGTVDNDPYRAAGFLLLLSPVFSVILFLLYLIATQILAWLKKLSLGSLLFVSFLSSLAFGVKAALDTDFGFYDSLISFGIFSVLSFFSFGIGSLAWWFVALRVKK